MDHRDGREPHEDPEPREGQTGDGDPSASGDASDARPSPPAPDPSEHTWHRADTPPEAPSWPPRHTPGPEEAPPFPFAPPEEAAPEPVPAPPATAVVAAPLPSAPVTSWTPGPAAPTPTWQPATLRSFETGPSPEATPDVVVKRGGYTRGKALGIALVAIAVIGAIAGAWLLLRDRGPGPQLLERGFEEGRTYSFRTSIRHELDIDSTELAISQYNSRVDGLVSVKVLSVKDRRVRMKARLNPRTVVVNEAPLIDPNVLKSTVNLHAFGTLYCSEMFFTPWRSTSAFLPPPQFGPPLPEHAVQVGEAWTINDVERCGEERVRYESRGRLASYEERDDERRVAVVKATTSFELDEGRVRFAGTAMMEETLRLDVDTGEILFAQGLLSGESQGPGPSSPTTFHEWLRYTLEPA